MSFNVLFTFLSHQGKEEDIFFLILSQSCQIVQNSRYRVYCLCKIGQHQSISIVLHSLMAADKDLPTDLYDLGAQPRNTDHRYLSSIITSNFSHLNLSSLPFPCLGQTS